MSQKPMSLLERKRLQWDREKEELIGLTSPWGRPPSLKLLTSSALTEGIKNLSTNINRCNQHIKNDKSSDQVIATSNYLTNLGILGNSQSEYHLPPIGLEKLQVRERDVGDEYEHSNSNKNTAERPYWLSRKRSLPLSLNTNVEEFCRQSRNFGQEDAVYRNNYHATQELIQRKYNDHNHTHERDSRKAFDKNSRVELTSMFLQNKDEDHYTSGYQSESNVLTGNDDSSGESEKDPQIFRRYRSNGKRKVSIDENDACIYTKEVDFHQTFKGWTKPTSYLYSKRNEMDHYAHRHGLEASDGRLNGSYEESLRQKSRSYVNNSRLHIPPPAMRSSFTNSIEAPDKDAYKDIKRQEHEQWLRDLEKQRDEQRLRKQMEREEKTGRWGDRGVVVGHLWEPASFPNSQSRLPPQGDVNGDYGADNGNQIPRWSETMQFHGVESESKINDVEADSEQTRSFILGQNVQIDPEEIIERENKKRQAVLHQEAVRKQMEERQQKLKDDREKRMEEERAEESKVLIYRLGQLKKLEMEERQKLIRKQENEFQQTRDGYIDNLEDTRLTKNETTTFHSNEDHHNSVLFNNHDIDNSCLIRKNLSTTFTLPPINPMVVSESSASISNSPQHRRSISPFQEYEATVLKDLEYPILEATENLTLTNSLSPSQSTYEFGTQTDTIIQDSYNFQVNESVINITETTELSKSMNPILENENSETKIKAKGKKKERPKWGIPTPVKQYMKQSEKDPYYQLRLQRRNERLKRREKQLKLVKTTETHDTGTDESEDSKVVTQNTKRAIFIKSKQKSLNNIKSTVGESREETPLKHTCNGIIEVISKNDEKETSNILPKATKSKFSSTNEIYTNEKDEESWRSSLLQDLESFQFNEDAEVVEAVEIEIQRNHSPPVPTLMKKIQFEISHNNNQHQEKIVHTASHTENNENIQWPSSAHVLSSVRPKKDKSPVESDSNESSPIRKFSPVTLVIESSAEYYKHPGNTTKLVISTNSEKDSTDTPLSPPLHLKQLMCELQNLGNYFPLDGKNESIGNGQSHSPPINMTSTGLKNSNRTIEFTIKLPVDYYQKSFQNLIDTANIKEKDENYVRRREEMINQRKKKDVESQYLNPLVEDKKKNTIKWLQSSASDSGSTRGNILNHLSTMKKGIRSQQEEWGVVPSDSENRISPYESSFYPSSEKSISSN